MLVVDVILWLAAIILALVVIMLIFIIFEKPINHLFKFVTRGKTKEKLRKLIESEREELKNNERNDIR